MPTYGVTAGRSEVVVVARSNVGPITFRSATLSGEVEAEVDGSSVRVDPAPRARLAVRIDGLTSGTARYDAELRQRMTADRFPAATIELSSVTQARDDRFNVSGDVTLLGITRPMSGTVTVRVDGARLVVDGEQMLDVRDFSERTPTMVMLRIYPDVRVVLHLEAEAVTPGRRGS